MKKESKGGLKVIPGPTIGVVPLARCVILERRGKCRAIKMVRATNVGEVEELSIPTEIRRLGEGGGEVEEGMEKEVSNGWDAVALREDGNRGEMHFEENNLRELDLNLDEHLRFHSRRATDTNLLS